VTAGLVFPAVNLSLHLHPPDTVDSVGGMGGHTLHEATASARMGGASGIVKGGGRGQGGHTQVPPIESGNASAASPPPSPPLPPVNWADGVHRDIQAPPPAAAASEVGVEGPVVVEGPGDLSWIMGEGGGGSDDGAWEP